MTGLGSDATGRIAIIVTQPTDGGGSLAATGWAGGGLALFGILITAAGAVVILRARSRSAA